MTSVEKSGRARSGTGALYPPTIPGCMRPILRMRDWVVQRLQDAGDFSLIGSSIRERQQQIAKFQKLLDKVRLRRVFLGGQD